jgi:hypothetical protein
MPITNILFLGGIIAAFAVFAAVLAWGEYQTRHLNRHGQMGRSQIRPAVGNRLPNAIIRSIDSQVSIAARGGVLDKVAH